MISTAKIVNIMMISPVLVLIALKNRIHPGQKMKNILVLVREVQLASLKIILIKINIILLNLIKPKIKFNKTKS